MSEGYHYEDEVARRSYDATLMRRLLGYVRPHRWLIFAAVCLLLVVSVLASLGPYFTMRAIDQYMVPDERVKLEEQIAAEGEDAPQSQVERLDELRRDDRQGLLSVIALLALLMAGEHVVRYIQNVIVAYVGQKTMFDMRVQLFEHLQRMSLRFLDRNPVGRLMTRVTNDVEKIQQTIVNGFVQITSDLFTIVIVLIFMFRINPMLSMVIITATVPCVFAVSWIFRKYASRSYLEIRKRIARLNAYMQENISGMRIVQVFGRQERNFEEYRKRNADHRDEWFRQIRYFATYFPVVDFLGHLAIALIFLYGGHQILKGANIPGSAPVTVGMLFAYIQWSERLYAPIRALADRYNLLLEAMAASERIFSLLDTPEEIENAAEAVSAEGIQGAVEFKDVWFSYDAAHEIAEGVPTESEAEHEPEWVIKGLNLSIQPGERIAIVGHTGAGKTTIINLLSRFYDIQKGAITIDGVDIARYDKTSLRRNIGIVLQDVFLFSGSIERNIRLSDETMTDEHVRACAQYVNAARFIERLNDGYEYEVGERGSNLSTGQRQLLAFARTLAHDPRILVLDEATSSVDTATEALIQDAILKLMESRTCIVIAHRLSTIQHADRIIVMHHGEVREQGTHQELLANRGLYYRLYRLQYKDQEPAA